MPNHVTQQLTIIGAEAPRVIEYVAGSDTALDFNRIVPLPVELKIDESSDGHMGLAAITGACARYLMFPCVKDQGIHTADEFRAFVEREHPQAIELARKYLANKQKFGHMTWRDWCVANWGTKWNAYSASTWDMFPNGAVIYFDTAWSPAIPAISSLSEMFTATAMTLRYFDEGWSFAGEAFFGSGLLEDNSFYPDEDDTRTLEIYREVYGTDFVANVDDD